MHLINVNILHVAFPLVAALYLDANAAPLEGNLTSGSLIDHSPCLSQVDPKTKRSPSITRESEVDTETWEILLNRASAALDAGNSKLAAESSLSAYCVAVKASEPASVVAETASVAIEAGLDFGSFETSSQINEDVQLTVLPNLAIDDPARLRFEMAQARILSFSDRNQDSLALRTHLQPNLIRFFGKGSKEFTINRIRIANTKLEIGHAREALLDLLALQEEQKSAPMSDTRVRILETHAIASALTFLGRESEALELLQSTRNKLAESLGDDDDRVLNEDQNLCEILIRMNRSDEAMEIVARVFRSRYEKLHIDSPQTLRALWDIAYLYVDTARFGTARAILDFLLKESRTPGARLTHQFYLRTLSLVANLDLSEGDLLSARDEWKTVYDGVSEMYGPDSENTQIEAMNLAGVYRMIGLQSEGCKLVEDVEASLLRTRPEDIWAVEAVHMTRESCLLKEGGHQNVETILASMRKSWEVISAHQGETSRDALAALATLANFTLRVGYRSEAKRLLTWLMELEESSRRSVSEMSITQMAAFAQWISFSGHTENTITGFRQLALLHAQDAELERALRISELVRDRTLQDRFAEQTWRHTQLPAKARDHVDKLIDRIQDLEEHIAVEPDIVERIRLESERTLLIAERRRLERQLRDRLHTAPSSPHPPTLDELRTRLAPDTALVSVLHSGDTWWALVILRNEPARFIDLQDPDLGLNASAWVQRLRGEAVRAWPLPGNRVKLDAVRPENAVGPYFTLDQLAKRLSDRLLLPLKEAVGNARHLVFVSDDELVGAPLQALPLGSGLALDRFEISYAPSLATYFRWQVPARSDAHALELLAIGAVDYHSIAPLATDDAIAIGVQVAENHPLPFARAEIDAIAALFPAARTTTWAGSQANKEALRHVSRTGALRRYRYVHIAAHAWAQADQPESSAIVLAGADEDLPTHRALTAAELAGLQMGSELIVLSACDTAAGHFEHGQGLLGLAYAGLAAGNRAALLSLWPVADDTTARFMVGLYAKLRHGETPALALAATQREFRHSGDPRLSDPLVWAPFILYGGY